MLLTANPSSRPTASSAEAARTPARLDPDHVALAGALALLSGADDLYVVSAMNEAT